MNLTAENECRVWGTAEYPDVCRRFTAQPWHCGETRDDALTLLARLEVRTDPKR